MMTRRTFTFASLAIAGAAYAGKPQKSQAPAPSPSQDAPPAVVADPAAAAQAPVDQAAPTDPGDVSHGLGGKWSVHAADGVLTVGLTLVNHGPEPIDVLVAQGSRQGPALQAFVAVGGEEVALVEVMPDLSREDLVSRMGPMPRFVPLVTGAETEIAPYKFTLPAGAEHDGFRLSATVDTSDNASIVLGYVVAPGDATPA